MKKQSRTITGAGQRLAAACLFLALSGCDGSTPQTTVTQPTGTHTDGAAKFTIEKLYSLPSLVGTTPEGYAWSHDGEQLAFLWNDEGRRFRDIWSYSLATGSKKRLTTYADDLPEDSELPGITQVVWLSEGRRLAYVMNGHLYLLDIDGNSEPVDDNRSNVADLQVSPNGQLLAFLADGALWVRSIGIGDDSPARQLAGGNQEKVFVESYEWSDDAEQIALVMTDNRGVREIEVHYVAGGEPRVERTTRAFPGDETAKRRVGVVDVGGGEVQWLSRPDDQEPIWGFGLSSDGRSLFIDSSDALVKERTIYVYDLETGTPAVFYRSTDPTQVMPGWAAAWAPDDAGLIILSDHEGFFHLYYKADANSAPRRLTTGNWEISSFEVDAENDLIYFLANEAHVTELQMYRVPVAGGEIERLSQEPGTHAPTYSPNFSHAADRFSNDTTPPDLYVNDLRAAAQDERITHSPRAEFDKLELADVSYVEFDSHVDGTRLVGRLSLPRDFDPSRRYPLLMGSIYPNSVRNRWGAGNAIPTWGLDQNLVDRGYILLKVDTRGSWGHGKADRQDLFHDYGGIDTDDIESGVRYLVAEGYADPERVGIFGWSYGGLMTLMSLFNKPDLYAVGIADAPASNVAHAFPSQMWVMGKPEGDDYPARYERMSALYHTAGLKKPLMITQATKDTIVLYSDTIALTERLIENGKLFELVSLPGSNHVWANDSLDQQIFGYRKMVEFFDRYLQP